MGHTQQTSHPEPRTSDKVHFWMGGALPSTFGAWAREQIRSRWFPLRRVTGAIAIIALNTTIASISGRSVVGSLQVGILVLSLVTVGVFVFRDRLRRRELRRYP